MAVRLIYITAGSEEEAVFIGRALVEERLAACANILGPTTSVYRWEGAVQTEKEFVLLVKTTDQLSSAVTEKVAALHSYDCPCVIALEVGAGHQPFLDWIEAETGVS